MQIRRYLHPTEFLLANRSILERDEAKNNLILGLAMELERNWEAKKADAALYAFHDFDIHGDPTIGHMHAHPKENHCFALRTGPRTGWVMAFTERMEERHALGIAGCLRAMHPDSASVQGALPWIDFIAKAYNPEATVKFEQILYSCTQVTDPPHPVSGKARMAREDELELLAEWIQRFLTEVRHSDVTLDEARENARPRIASGTVMLWEDGGKPVSMAFLVRPSTHGGCIGYVYTPDRYRGKGYASAVTAALTRKELEGGRAFLMLYTDATNATSNHIYQEIGYKPICDARMWNVL